MRISAARYMRFLICFALLHPVAVCNLMHAQIDSFYHLDEIQVTALRIDVSDIGKHTDRIDSQALALRHYDHLASMIASQTPLFVRSYGGGTLATLGIRGGGAAHTQIIWNGIPLRNPMLGLVDLALLPAAFIDKASIHYGGHGAAFGSGAVGGLISISNDKLSLSNGIQLEMSLGSWNMHSGKMQIDYGTKKIRFSSRLFSYSTDNNYRYKISKDTPEKNQVHHRLHHMGLLQEMYLPISKRQSLSMRLWYQNANRQIPPTSTQNISKAAQQDHSIKTMLQWNHQGAKINWQVKTAWLDETIDYQDTLIELYTNNRFTSWLAEAETAFRIKHHLHFTGGVNMQVDMAESANYEEGTKRNQNAFFSSVRLILKDWLWRFQLREEVTQGSWSPLLLDLSSEWAFVDGLSLKANVSRNYRFPTLNDLHWRPGGNPGLSPEQGWTYEAGLHFIETIKKTSISSSLTAYTRTIDDWIMWTPPISGVRNYWAPINIAEINSRGFETRARMSNPAQHLGFDLNLGLDLTWSTFATPLTEFNIEEGDQLFYVPVVNAMGGAQISYHKFSIFYDHHWFGPSTGINDALSAGNVGSGGIRLGFEKIRIKGAATLQVDNVWNVPYRIIERRPMAGRTITGSIRFFFS